MYVCHEVTLGSVVCSHSLRMCSVVVWRCLWVFKVRGGCVVRCFVWAFEASDGDGGGCVVTSVASLVVGTVLLWGLSPGTQKCACWGCGAGLRATVLGCAEAPGAVLPAVAQGRFGSSAGAF